jgi:hypothetical protein
LAIANTVAGAMIRQRTNTSIPGLEDRLRDARRRGFADGVASVLGGSMTGPQRRVCLRQQIGSLEQDWQELRRDGERLFHESP